MNPENWVNIELQNISVQGCQIGFTNKNVWPISEINCRAKNCYIGWSLRDDVTSRSSIRCRSLSNRWAIVIKSDYRNIYGQVFDGFHMEACVMGIVIDPSDNGRVTIGPGKNISAQLYHALNWEDKDGVLAVFMLLSETEGRITLNAIRYKKILESESWGKYNEIVIFYRLERVLLSIYLKASDRL